MKSYTSFADYYDFLMKDAGYSERADYIIEILKKFNHNSGITLDLACGTGNLTIELAKRNIDIYGIDASQEMLSKAMEKSFDNDMDILFLCQKMQNLNLFGTIDTCVSSMDSINHLTKKDDVQKTFDKVGLFTVKGGYFIFDCNTIFKHNNILANNTFVYDIDEVFCVWQNSLQKDNIVNITLDFFEPHKNVYYRNTENFSEKAYYPSEIEDMLSVSGFKLMAMYDDLTFTKPKEDSQRIVYVAQKIVNHQKV